MGHLEVMLEVELITCGEAETGDGLWFSNRMQTIYFDQQTQAVLALGCEHSLGDSEPKQS